MGLLETVQDAASSAIKGVGNIARKAVYISVENPSPVFVPGTTPKTAQEVSYNLNGVVKTGFKQGEVDGELIKAEDFKVLIANKDLAPTPTKDDYIEIDSIRYRVIDYRLDPADALYTFQVRLA